jgi:Xaa-Pro aminopeptidase
VGVAEHCVAATVGAIAPGVTERELLGVFERTMGGLGITTPAFEASACAAGASPRWIVSDRALRTGDLVNVRGGVLVDGWEGVLARSWGCGGATGPQAAGGERAGAALADAVAACGPGTLVADLRGRADVTTVEGVGVGHEELADDEVLAASDVVYVEVFVGQVLLGDVVHVTERGPKLLTTTPLDLA